jgi:hypothetical protein
MRIYAKRHYDRRFDKVIWELDQEQAEFYIALLEDEALRLPYIDEGIRQDVQALREAVETLWPAEDA